MGNGKTEKLMDTSQMSTRELIDALAPEPEDAEREAVAVEASEANQVQADAVVQADPASATADAAATEQEVVPGTETTAETAAAPAPALPTGHDRAIVKAARAAEARARKEVAKLEREVQELRAKVGAAPAEAAAKKPPAEVLEDVKRYAPEAGQYIEVLESQVEELKKTTPKPSAAEPEFTPDILHKDPDEAAAIQAELDQVPEISSWHADPDQTNWTRAKAIDAMLVGSPRWQGKPFTARLAEVVRLRKEELADAGGRARDVSASDPEPSTAPKKPAAKPTAEDARKVIEAKAKTPPVSAADIRGRSPPTRIASKREAWHGMTNEQLLAQLPDIPE